MYCFFQSLVKRQVRVYFLFLIMVLSCAGQTVRNTAVAPLSTGYSVNLDANRTGDVYRAENVDGNYLFFLEKLFLTAESKGGSKIIPSQFPRIALKIKSAYAPGLQVSRSLVDALLAVLRKRGYGEDQILLVDREREGLVSGGFLVVGQTNNRYQGYPVVCSVDQAYYNPIWFHDSPMPPTLHDRARLFLRYPFDREMRMKEERKSFLPRILFEKDTFWISLAVATDNLHLGIDGASANMTTGAISNFQRFLEKPTLAPAAVTEILAIPEIWQKRAYSIVDLSRFQFANGGKFDAEFLGRESTLLLSENPFSVDRVALESLNDRRKKMGFSERGGGSLLLFKYAQELGLGDWGKTKIVQVR